MAGYQSPIISIMIAAARKAARYIVRDFGELENLQVTRKGPADFVTTADTRTEKILREELRRARPAFGFLGEEGGEEQGSDPTHRWIIDPIDGTTNFMHGIPHFSIAIALEHRFGIVAGVIFDVMKDEIFWAEKGKGAYVNDRRIRVSGRRDLTQCLIATGLPFAGKDGHEQALRDLAAIMPRVAGIRRAGCASLDLAYVAAGRVEGFWEPGLSLWDIAAGVLMVREAGGTVNEIGGGRNVLASGNVLASNGEIQGTLNALLLDARKGTKAPA